MNNLSFRGHLQFIHFRQSLLQGDVEFKKLIVSFFTWLQPWTNYLSVFKPPAPSGRACRISSGKNGGFSSGSIFRERLAHEGLLALAMLTVVLCAVYTRAQDNYEIQVYGYELVDPGHTMVELHSNFTIDGSKEAVDGVYPTNHAAA